MIAYYITGSNNVAIRTSPFTSGSALTMSLENMTTLDNTTSSISQYTYDGYESLLQFTASISGSGVGEEYRAVLLSGGSEIWHGSIQVYTSESIVSSYTNQNTQYKSHQSENKYIIMN